MLNFSYPKLFKMSRLKGAISAVLLFCLLLSEFSYAGPEVFSGLRAASNPVEFLSKNPASFEAPLDFCSLKEIHSGSSSKLIIHIQDAHSNLSGQENLAKILDYVMTRYKVTTVLSEGGEGDCSLTSLKKITTPEVWQRVARKYLIEGKICGEEYLNLTSDHRMKIVGVENASLYVESVRNYALLAKQREEILAYLGRVERALGILKNRLYPKELLEYEKSKDKSTRDFSQESIKKLLVLAQKGSALEKFPTIRQLRVLEDQESKIDFKLANLEQAALLDALFKHGAKISPEEALKSMSGPKNQKISNLAYIQNAFKIAKNKNISLVSYSNLLLYERYLEEFSRVDLDRFLDEFVRLEDQVYGTHLKEEDQKLTRSIDRYLGLLKIAYQIQMSTKDFETFKVNEPDFGTIPCLAFINTKLSELGYSTDMIPYKNNLEKGKEALTAFYDSVSRRDLAFVENAEKSLKNEKQEVAILITGGYHTSHLKKLFYDKGYSFITLSPLVTSETNQKKYEELLLEPISYVSKKIELVAGQKGQAISDRDGVRVALIGSALGGARLAGLRDEVLSQLSGTFPHLRGVGEGAVGARLAKGLESFAPNGKIPDNVTTIYKYYNFTGNRPYRIALNWYTAPKALIDRRDGSGKIVKLIPVSSFQDESTYLEIKQTKKNGDFMVCFVRSGQRGQEAKLSRTFARGADAMNGESFYFDQLESCSPGRDFIDYLNGFDSGDSAKDDKTKMGFMEDLAKNEMILSKSSRMIREPEVTIGGLCLALGSTFLDEMPLRLVLDQKDRDARFALLIDEFNPSNRIYFEVLSQGKLRILGTNEVLEKSDSSDRMRTGLAQTVRGRDFLEKAFKSVHVLKGVGLKSNTTALLREVKISICGILAGESDRRWLSISRAMQGIETAQPTIFSPACFVDINYLKADGRKFPKLSNQEIENNPNLYVRVPILQDWAAPQWISRIKDGKTQFFWLRGTVGADSIYRLITQDEGVVLTVEADRKLYSLDGVSIDGQPLFFESGVHQNLSAFLSMLVSPDTSGLGRIPKKTSRKINFSKAAENLLLLKASQIFKIHHSVVPTRLKFEEGRWIAYDFKKIKYDKKNGTTFVDELKSVQTQILEDLAMATTVLGARLADQNIPIKKERSLDPIADDIQGKVQQGSNVLYLDFDDTMAMTQDLEAPNSKTHELLKLIFPGDEIQASNAMNSLVDLALMAQTFAPLPGLERLLRLALDKNMKIVIVTNRLESQRVLVEKILRAINKKFKQPLSEDEINSIEIVLSEKWPADPKASRIESYERGKGIAPGTHRFFIDNDSRNLDQQKNSPEFLQYHLDLKAWSHSLLHYLYELGNSNIYKKDDSYIQLLLINIALKLADPKLVKSNRSEFQKFWATQTDGAQVQGIKDLIESCLVILSEKGFQFAGDILEDLLSQARTTPKGKASPRESRHGDSRTPKDDYVKRMGEADSWIVALGGRESDGTQETIRSYWHWKDVPTGVLRNYLFYLRRSEFSNDQILSIIEGPLEYDETTKSITAARERDSFVGPKLVKTEITPQNVSAELFDGPTLLLLAKAASVLGQNDSLPLIIRFAENSRSAKIGRITRISKDEIKFVFSDNSYIAIKLSTEVLEEAQKSSVLPGEISAQLQASQALPIAAQGIKGFALMDEFAKDHTINPKQIDAIFLPDEINFSALPVSFKNTLAGYIKALQGRPGSRAISLAFLKLDAAGELVFFNEKGDAFTPEADEKINVFGGALNEALRKAVAGLKNAGLAPSPDFKVNGNEIQMSNYLLQFILADMLSCVGSEDQIATIAQSPQVQQVLSMLYGSRYRDLVDDDSQIRIIQGLVKYKTTNEGHRTQDDFYAKRLFSLLQPIQLEVAMQGARLVCEAVGVAA